MCFYPVKVHLALKTSNLKHLPLAGLQREGPTSIFSQQSSHHDHLFPIFKLNQHAPVLSPDAFAISSSDGHAGSSLQERIGMAIAEVAVVSGRGDGQMVNSE